MALVLPPGATRDVPFVYTPVCTPCFVRYPVPIIANSRESGAFLSRGGQPSVVPNDIVL